VQSDLDLQVVDLARDLLFTALVVAGPLLLVGLVVGVAVSLFQALTSVQEQTMSLIPKMFAVFVVSLLLLAPALGILRDYALRIISQLNTFGLS
jgi:flagellar biosynthetic protein FliQ